MKNYLLFSMAALLACTSCAEKPQKERPFSGVPGEVRLITLDPGHFHAALVQKTAYPEVSQTVYIYAPEGFDVNEHLKRIDGFNNRVDSPTEWEEIVYTGPDFLEKMLTEQPGNVMIVAGNNGKKTAYIRQALQHGIHVLSDKPMAIDREGYDLLQSCFDMADDQDLLLYDIMTERNEITSMLQRDLSRIPAIYGEQLIGTPEDPAVVKESVHHFYKTVAGNPLKRPAWYFDVEQQGEGIVDVTTHLVDLVQWETFPDEVLTVDDVYITDANRWTTPISAEEFTQVTGAEAFPDFLQKDVKNDTLYVYCNGDISYQLKGVNAKVSVIWDYTFPEGGGDTHYSVMKGSKSNLIIRQEKEQNYKPELYIEITPETGAADYEKTLHAAFSDLEKTYPGIALQQLTPNVWQVMIPDQYRVGHEAHFGQVTEKYLQYLKEGALPYWETPNMKVKYHTTTSALERAKQKEANQKSQTE